MDCERIRQNVISQPINFIVIVKPGNYVPKDNKIILHENNNVVEFKIPEIMLNHKAVPKN
jgi:hypothetical protein